MMVMIMIINIFLDQGEYQAARNIYQELLLLISKATIHQVILLDNN